MDAKPEIIQARTYVHSRFMAENLDFEVTYIAEGIPFSQTMQNRYEELQRNSLPVISISRRIHTEWNFEVIQGLMGKDSVLVPFDHMYIQTGAIFIYNNFTEMIMSNTFYETFINRTENVEGTGRFFASHGNYAGEAIDYVIRFENLCPHAITMLMCGDVDSQTEELYNDIVIRRHNLSFYGKRRAGLTEARIIEANGKLDIPIQDVGDGQLLTAMIDFDVSEPVTVTAFVLPSSERSRAGHYDGVPTPVVPYDYDYVPEGYVPSEKGMATGIPSYTLYSGWGEGYKIYGENTVTASKMEGRPYGFETGAIAYNLNEKKGLKEIIEINLAEPRGVNGEITKAVWVGNVPWTGEVEGRHLKHQPRNYCNLGNWGADYEIVTNLINDTDRDMVFTLNLHAFYQSTLVVQANDRLETVNLNNRIYYGSLEREQYENYDIVRMDPEAKSWKVVSVTVPARQERQFQYNYYLGTDSVANVYHLWSGLAV